MTGPARKQPSIGWAARAAGTLLAAGALLAATAVAWQALEPREILAGTNGVRTVAAITGLAPSERLCQEGLVVPEDAGRLRVSVGAPGAPRPTLAATFESGGNTTARVRAPPSPAAPAALAEFPLPPRVAGSTGRLCLSAEGGSVGVLGFPVPSAARPLRQDGRAVPGELAIAYPRREGERSSLLAAWPTLMERAGAFRPDGFGTWLAWLLVTLLAPLSAIGSIAAVLRARRLRPATLVTVLALAAVAQGASWAWTTGPFDGPDEPEHFAYVESFAAAGRVPDATDASPAPPPTYSSAQSLLLDAVRHPTRVGSPEGRLILTSSAETAYEREQRRRDPPADDGGGPSIAASPQSPLYYGLLAPAWSAGRFEGESGALHVTRLMSALWLALIAASAFGIVRELAPGRPELAATAGGLAALQPMLGFMGGVVNNDAAVNGLAALTLYLVIRALRRGPARGTLAAAGLAGGAMAVAKGTGLALVPLVALGFAAMLVRYRRRALAPVALGAGALVIVLGAWGALAPSLDRGVSEGPAVTVPIGEALGQPGNLASYIWQVLLPPLPGMTDHWLARWPFFELWVKQPFGAYGWVAHVISDTTALIVLAALAVAVGGGLLALFRHRARLRSIGWELGLLALAPLLVLLAVHAVHVDPGIRPAPAEQGRYILPVAAPVAAMAVAGLAAMSPRWATRAGATAVLGMALLGVHGRLLYLAGMYT